MMLIGNTVVSLDILEKDFCCNLPICKGCCCIEGDAGAPITEAEKEQLESLLPMLKSEMSEEAQRAVDEGGLCYRDKDGELVTQIVNGRDCVFAKVDHNGWCYCLIEKAYRAGKTDFMKPISCHLYPIRVKEFAGKDGQEGMVALEYNRWDICHAARVLGKKEHVAVYQFLKEPLIRRFGEAWYAELCLTAEEWKKQCKRI